MLERLNDVPDGIVAMKAAGKVSKEDHEKSFEPALDEARRERRRVRLLYQFGPDFEGFTAGGAWEDLRAGLRAMKLCDGCAVVADGAWIRGSARLAGFVMPCPVHVFSNQERAKAVEWLRALPGGVFHYLLPETGVLVVEVKEPLRSRDFDQMAVTSTAWIDAHGGLQGLVIHTQEFPGWENAASMLRHLRFVREHHRKIRRIALVTSSRLVSLAPSFGEHFVKTEVRGFGYPELKAAIAWAGAAGPVHTSTVHA
jgi:hypothetical protein